MDYHPRGEAREDLEHQAVDVAAGLGDVLESTSRMSPAARRAEQPEPTAWARPAELDVILGSERPQELGVGLDERAAARPAR